MFYANPNLAAIEFADDEVKNNPGIYSSPEIIAKAFVMSAHTPDFKEVLTRIKTGQ
ncbi:MAG: hypothetical protein MO846_06735 [Candidatus Devosia symbiotica]|nr:hypothetical protein [Candidatus Devosia symbiotica]